MSWWLDIGGGGITKSRVEGRIFHLSPKTTCSLLTCPFQGWENLMTQLNVEVLYANNVIHDCLFLEAEGSSASTSCAKLGQKGKRPKVTNSRMWVIRVIVRSNGWRNQLSCSVTHWGHCVILYCKPYGENIIRSCLDFSLWLIPVEVYGGTVGMPNVQVTRYIVLILT